MARFGVATFLVLLAWAEIGLAQVVEVRLRPVKAGDQSVSGFVLPEPASAAGFVLEVYDVSGAAPRFLDRKTIDKFERGGGFVVQLTSPAGSNQRFEVTQGGMALTGGTTTTPAAVSPAPPRYTLHPVHPGERTVTGFFSDVPRSLDGLVVEIREANAFIERKAIDKVEAGTGTFSVSLAAPLRTNQTVSIGSANGTAVSTGTSIGAQTTILTSLFDGARTVRGHLSESTGIASVRIEVRRSALEYDDSVQHGGSQDYVQTKSTAIAEANANGDFAVTLDGPLVAGQVVIGVAVTAGGERGSESEPVTVTDPGSWGRARAYFAGGVVFSKERDDFSKQDLALTFVIDKGWLQKHDFTLPPERARVQMQLTELKTAREACRMRAAGAKAANDQCNADYDAGMKPYRADGAFTFRQLNTFLDARLTSLPVATAPGATTTTTPGAGSTSSTEQFVDSRKGALMQVGIYAPVYGPQTSWVHEGAVNALFIAPVFRYGIQTITSADGKPTVNAKGEPDDVYNFWGFGFGLGHHKLSGTTNQTPEIISYLHVVFGKAEAFEYKDADGKLVNKTRAIVEGRLKIPNTALQVGFDANLGGGRDDIRFVFGTRFDIGELFGRLRGFQP